MWSNELVRAALPTLAAVVILGLVIAVALWPAGQVDPSPPVAGRTGPARPSGQEAPAPARSTRVREATQPEEAIAPDGVPKDTATASNPVGSNFFLGLGWLRRHQGADGRWNDPATTGTVLLAFLGAGETHQAGSNRESVKKALTALIAGQDEDGCLVPRTSSRALREHAMAGLALSEAYGMTSSRWLKEPAQRAVEFARGSRVPRGAWSLASPEEEELDVETTAWMSLLLKNASLSGLDVDEADFPEILAALDRVTDPATGRIRPTVRVPAPLSEEAATAMGFSLRVFLGTTPEQRRHATSADWLLAHPLADKAAEWLVAHPPAPDTGDLDYVYFGSKGMIALGGDRFRAWLPALNQIVGLAGVADGPDKGSWDPPDGGEVARIRATAYHVTFCEAYFGPVGHASMRK